MDKWLAALLEQMLKVISPNLKKAVEELVLKLEEQAKATPNPWDDIFVGLLKRVIGM